MSASKVIIVENDQNLLDALEYNLSKEGYEVITATHGIQALEVAQSEKTGHADRWYSSQDVSKMPADEPGLDSASEWIRTIDQRFTKLCTIIPKRSFTFKLEFLC